MIYKMKKTQYDLWFSAPTHDGRRSTLADLLRFLNESLRLKERITSIITY